MRKKRISFVVILMIIMQLFTGCKDAMEVNNIAIVTGVALDKMPNGEILLTILIPVTRSAAFGGLLGGTSPEKESTTIISEKGKSIMDAYRKMEEKLSRKIFFPQNDGIFIGEELAQDGVSEVIDFFYRYPESHLRPYMFFTKGQASQVLSMRSILERSLMEKFVKSENLVVGFKTNLRDFLNMITEEGVEPAAAKIEFKPVLEVNTSGAQTTGIDGSAVLHKYKLVGWITEEETRGALILRNEIKRGIITTNISDEKNGGKISIEIIKSRTKITPIINGDETKMDVKIYMEGNIYENSSKLDLSNVKEIHLVEDAVRQNVEKRIELVLEKLQKQLKSDILGFGNTIYRKYPKKWNSYYKEHWDEEFPKVKVKITCDVRILDIGLQSKNLTSDNGNP